MMMDADTSCVPRLRTNGSYRKREALRNDPDNRTVGRNANTRSGTDADARNAPTPRRGFAGDYVEAMWRIVQADEPGDYVVATGKMHT